MFVRLTRWVLLLFAVMLAFGTLRNRDYFAALLAFGMFVVLAAPQEKLSLSPRVRYISYGALLLLMLAVGGLKRLS